MREKLSSIEIKKTELEILTEFDKFCKENGLSYCLCGGTLLGAVRHKGFIPWDDDIDVLMPRPAFEEVLRMSLNQKSDSRYRFVSWKTGNSPYPFIKMIDTTTEVKEEYLDEKYKIGVWIDIFAYDGMPSDDRIIKKKFKQIKRNRLILMTAISESDKGTTWYAKMIKRVLVPFFKHLNVPKLCDKINALASEYPLETSPYVGGFLWGYGPQEKMPRTLMDTVELEFEGHMFKAPACWDTYLSNLYGDYMQLPPENKRIHHCFDAYRIKAVD